MDHTIYHPVIKKLHTNQRVSCLAIVLCFVLFLNNCQPAPTPFLSSSFESNRFQLEDLARNLNEPMALDILPDRRILLIERRGILKVYDPGSQVIKVAGELEVNYINENGLLGMVVDPDFSANSWIYLFYTDPFRKSYQHISRFEFKNDSLLTSSEKVLLDYYIDYDNCCHFGGSLDFGPEGLLYISTGDNVTGTDFGPIDERPGHHLDDAQRSSANSMDLRGKILRIRPQTDGTYSIPEGNLFPPGTSFTRPEIYVMGVRNPFKFKADQQTGWLFWGEVGPNPGEGDPKRGPRAHEEINLAKSAGNYGWPYLIGDNKAYHDYNYQTGEIGPVFDPQYLVNNSPNNTGIQQLPPAQKSLIWYPNVVSDSFPLMGQGGGTACAGPLYHYEEIEGSAYNFPRKFDNNLFIYDWMRGWILAVSLDPEGKYLGMEKFLPGTPFKKPIDMRFGPDGALYVLDYGSNWYAHNKDARLTRVSYIYGNRPPVAHISTDKKMGKAPFKVLFSGDGSFDKDQGASLKYEWSFHEGTSSSHQIYTKHIFEKSGTYEVTLKVTDEYGEEATASEIIQVGNDPPKVEVSMNGNQSFFTPGQDISYNISVQDTEDGNSMDGTIEEAAVNVRLLQLKNTNDVNGLREIESIHEPSLAFMNGKKLMEGSDCYGCHALDAPSVGPSLLDISKKYLSYEAALEQLSLKVKLGGSGVWGDKLMTAHPQHNYGEVREMTAYILALAKNPETGISLPLKGSFSTLPSANNDLYVLSAIYFDKGAQGMPPIRREERAILRSTQVPGVSYDLAYRVIPKPYNEVGDLYAEIALNGSYVGFREIDLTGITSIRVKLRSNANFIKVDLRAGDSQGELLSSKRLDLPFVENKWIPFTDDDWFYLDLLLAPSRQMGDLYFIFYSDKKESDYIYFDICQLHSLEFVFDENVNF